MPAPSWEDLGEFFDPEEFATTARLWREGEDLGEITGIHDHPTDRKELGDYTIDETGPRFLCAETAGAKAKRGDVLQVDGEYRDIVQQPTRDGTGVVVLELSEPKLYAWMQDGATYLTGPGGVLLTDEGGAVLEDG